MEKDQYIYIEHILESLNKIIEFTKEQDENSFLNNELIKDAVIRNFEVIGRSNEKYI